MNSLLFAGLGFTCAGALCGIAGDMTNRSNLGLVSFLALNVIIWTRFFFQAFSLGDIGSAAELFLVSQGAATCSYVAMIFFLAPPARAFVQQPD